MPLLMGENRSFSEKLRKARRNLERVPGSEWILGVTMGGWNIRLGCRQFIDGKALARDSGRSALAGPPKAGSSILLAGLLEV